jgi:integrase
MPRPATGQVLVHERQRGRVYQLRFRTGGKRRCLTLGTAEEGWTQEKAERELADTLALVRKGVWSPPAPPPAVEEPTDEPTFHEFASEWLERREQRGDLRPRTLDDLRWSLSGHLLPYFASHRVSQITYREIERYVDAKVAERRAAEEARKQGKQPDAPGLSAGSINKTVAHLSRVLKAAAKSGLLSSNPAADEDLRLKAARPKRPLVWPEQVMALLEASEGVLVNGRGRPLLATMIGTGMRIGEVLALQRRHVDLHPGTITVIDSKTEAGVRTIDLPPALRDELAIWLDRSPFKEPGDFVFPTSTGKEDTRGNVRKRLGVRAFALANEALVAQGIRPIMDGAWTNHSMRRTFATLRLTAGEAPLYVAKQIGHTDPAFTLKCYADAVEHDARLSDAARKARERAVEWASMTAPEWALSGAEGLLSDSEALVALDPEQQKGPAFQGL